MCALKSSFIGMLASLIYQWIQYTVPEHIQLLSGNLWGSNWIILKIQDKEKWKKLSNEELTNVHKSYGKPHPSKRKGQLIDTVKKTRWRTKHSWKWENEEVFFLATNSSCYSEKFRLGIGCFHWSRTGQEQN